MSDELTLLQQQLECPSTTNTQPQQCGVLPLSIDHLGRWFYQQTEIMRPELVRLFASVLLKQQEKYFLQTPAEKIQIQVADAPFLITDWHWLRHQHEHPALSLTTNLGEQLVVNQQNPIRLQQAPDLQWLPYVQLKHGLTAKLSRNVFYQLAEQAAPVYTGASLHYQIKSLGFPYTLAIVSPD